MARPKRRAPVRRAAHPGWRVTPTAVTAVAAAITIAIATIVRPVRAFTQLSENVRAYGAATEQLARSVEQLAGKFERVNALERDVALLKHKAGIR
jgi:negative regulator of sigma E activity